MTALARVLTEVGTGARTAGVFACADDVPTGWLTAVAGAAAIEAERLGWVTARLDAAATDRAQVLIGLGRALSFPSWYGANLDALADCLRDLESPRGTLLIWPGWTVFAATDPGSCAAVFDVLQARAAQTPPFVVLLLGRAPESIAPEVGTRITGSVDLGADLIDRGDGTE